MVWQAYLKSFLNPVSKELHFYPFHRLAQIELTYALLILFTHLQAYRNIAHPFMFLLDSGDYIVYYHPTPPQLSLQRLHHYNSP